MLMKRFTSILLILSWSGDFAQAQVTQEAPRLEPGKPIEREIASGETHIYRVLAVRRRDTVNSI